MALGDKLPVVMGREKAAPSGVATLGADGILAESQRPGLAQIRGGSNPNLLLNWDFRNPVNQNGDAEYVGNRWTIDRWHADAAVSKITLRSRCLRVGISGAGSGIPYLFSYYVPAPKDLVGKQITLSLFVENVPETASISFALRMANSGTFVLASTPKILQLGLNSVTIRIPTGTQIDEAKLGLFTSNISADNYVDLVAAKMEIGDHQTLARKNEDGEWEIIDPPDYDLQYLLCSQYSPSTGEWVGSQHSTPNLLDNWYFVGGGSQQGGGQLPINQRGKVEYAGIGYTIDRWKSTNGNLTVNVLSDCIKLTAATAGQGYLRHLFDQPLPAGTYTYSALVRGTGSGFVQITNKDHDDWGNEAYFEAPGDNWILATNTFTVKENFLKEMYFRCNSGRSYDIKACKLELGPISTLARKEGDAWVLNDPPPNYQQELAKCQRSQVFGHLSSIPFVKSGSDYLVFLPLPVPLRAIPTIIGKPNVYNVSNSVKATGATVAVKRLDKNGVILTVSNVNEPCVVYFGPETDIGLDANL